MMFPAERAVELMEAYRDFMADAPDEVCGCCAVLCAPPEEFVPEPARGKPVFGMIACYVGPVDEGERALAPVRAWGPVVEMVGPIPYAEGIQRLIEPGNPPGRRQYWKAGFLQELTRRGPSRRSCRARPTWPPRSRRASSCRWVARSLACPKRRRCSAIATPTGTSTSSPSGRMPAERRLERAARVARGQRSRMTNGISRPVRCW